MEFKLDEAQEKRLKEWQNNIKELFGGREVVVIVANVSGLCVVQPKVKLKY
jgi:hypothetical protein